MIKVYTANSLAMAGYVQGALESAGLRCMVRNQYLSGGIGELPPTDCWPEVWVVNDHAAAQARAILAELLGEGDGEAPPAWTCGSCGERIDGQFAQCWNCQAAAPGGADR